MGVKILLADDSPTVHKVIKIILKDEGCSIVECSRDAELVEKLNQSKPQIVFLDFNFSESKTGYDLCRMIKSASPQTKILVMFGTFDTVDENLLREVGADQHVVKPFDTAKFVSQVRSLSEGAAAAPQASAPQKASEPSMGDWTIRETVERKSPNIQAMTNETVANLQDDLNDWGMLVPGIIGKSAGAPDLPPVIESSSAKKSKTDFALPKSAPVTASSPAASSGAQLPSDADLEYPDLGGSSSLTQELETTPSPKSKLISLNELHVSETETTSTSQLLKLSGMDDEGAKLIEEQIRDEIEEDLWTVDTYEEPAPKLSVVKEEQSWESDEPTFAAASDKKFGELMDGDNAFDESLFEPLDKGDKPATYHQSSSSKSIELSDLSSSFSTNPTLPADLNALRPLLELLVREAVQEYCRQNVEKVAWEVIPDLAENLIKNELKKLSEKVSRDL